MSKKIYMKPGIETAVFNNNDDNMVTYLTTSNHNFRKLTEGNGTNTFTLHQ